jgi:hypothetical protein
MPAISRIELYIKLSISYIAYGLQNGGIRDLTVTGGPSYQARRPRESGHNKDKHVWKSSQQDARLQKNPERDPRPHRVR